MNAQCAFPSAPNGMISSPGPTGPEDSTSTRNAARPVRGRLPKWLDTVLFASLLALTSGVLGCSDRQGAGGETLDTAPAEEDGGATLPDTPEGGDGQPDTPDTADPDGTVGPDAPSNDTTSPADGDDADAGEGTDWECIPDPGGEEICDNGLDDDCDGLVDEVCGCTPPEATQACYFGDPAHLEVENGRCQAGEQICGLEFWSLCEGAIGPDIELCDDNIDNDCDGEIDEDCSGDLPQAICPADFSGSVLSSHRIQGEYFDPNGEPMTRATYDITAPPGFSYDLTYDPDGLGLEFFADVAGEYVFQLTVFNQFGSDSCSTVFTAETADIIRVELYWNPDFIDSDETGIDCTDFDLYVHQAPTDGSDWGYYRPNGTDGWPNPDVCNWQNCATCTVPYDVGDAARERDCREFLTEQSEACPDDEVCPAPN